MILELSKTFSKEKFFKNFKLVLENEEYEGFIKEVFENAQYIKINIYFPRNILGIDIFDLNLFSENTVEHFRKEIIPLLKIINEKLSNNPNEFNKLLQNLSDYLFKKIIENRLNTLKLLFDNSPFGDSLLPWINEIINDVLKPKKDYYIEAKSDILYNLEEYRSYSFHHSFKFNVVTKRYMYLPPKNYYISDLPFCKPRLLKSRITLNRMYRTVSNFIDYMKALIVIL